jgi:hypothetical protein
MGWAQKADLPWVTISWKGDDPESDVGQLDVDCEACEQNTTLFVGEAGDAFAQRVDDEVERHRLCGALVEEDALNMVKKVSE